MPASNSLSKKSSARRRQRWRPGRPWLPRVAALTARCCPRWPPATPPTLRAKIPSAPFWSLCRAAPGHAWARSRSSGTSATAAGGWCCKGVWKFCGLFVEVAIGNSVKGQWRRARFFGVGQRFRVCLENLQ